MKGALAWIKTGGTKKDGVMFSYLPEKSTGKQEEAVSTSPPYPGYLTGAVSGISYLVGWRGPPSLPASNFHMDDCRKGDSEPFLARPPDLVFTFYSSAEHFESGASFLDVSGSHSDSRSGLYLNPLPSEPHMW